MWEKGKGLNGNYKTKSRFYLTSKTKNIFGHPTTKPIEIIKNLIINASKENDLVLDCFLGSGTTALACKQLGRKCLGIETSPEYCKIAKQRLSQEILT